jgi:hypothetical protein
VFGLFGITRAQYLVALHFASTTNAYTEKGMKDMRNKVIECVLMTFSWFGSHREDETRTKCGKLKESVMHSWQA